jgi:tetratricopeptide (TPR) repeat protein/thiol-disulfide isomerase/thioredoxin
VSQTPIGDQPSRELLAYDKGWAALNLMLREGKSFSGRERNCAFLNIGKPGGRFANISAVSGLDLIDDGRGLAYTDWDFDGDLDLWTTARTGPRVRLLRNDFPQGEKDARWVALCLQGTTSNRDGIGARVNLLLKDGSRRVKSLSAGHGHLSQSTKWLHFGIGDAAGIEGAIVHWPGGKSERFSGITRGGRFLLIQDSGTAKKQAVPDAGRTLDDAPLTLPAASGSQRIVLLKPALTPELKATNLDGKPLDLSPGGKPVLLNLWATWCAPCVEEMKDWTESREALEKSGLRVVSVSVDEPADGLREKIVAFAGKLEYPFETGLPGDGLLNALDAAQLAFIGYQGEMPVPCSFLIDARGRLAVIYKGSVSAAQIGKDMALLGAGMNERLAAAIPFSGRWIEKPSPVDASKIAGKFALRGQLEEAADCVDTCLARNEADTGLITTGEQASLHRIRGAVTMDLKRYEDSLESWTAVLRIMPDDRNAYLETAKCHTYLGNPEAAGDALKGALKLRRSDPQTLFELGKIQAKTGRHSEAILTFKEALSLASTYTISFELANSQIADGKIADAIASLRQTLKLRPDWPIAANNLAWILATCPDASLRDGKEAVAIATNVCKETDYKYASGLSTLAAAHAETGDFDSAMKHVASAIAVATERKQPQHRIDAYFKRQELYQAKKPQFDQSLAPR